MKRLFLAIDIPDNSKEEVISTYQAIHGARWVNEKQLHVTLRFLGDTAPSQEERLVSALGKIRFDPFEIKLRGVGCFPPRNDPNILWIGIDKSFHLRELQHTIESIAVRCGFPHTTRTFSPHLTVARLKGISPERVAFFLVSNSLFKTNPFRIHSIHLYSSQLRKDGAHYTREVTFSAE